MVPKIIHRISGKTPSKLVSMCMESWVKAEKVGFKIRDWNDSSLTEFIKSNYDFALEAFLNARNHAEAADIARYLLVFHYGGYYVDWDTSLNNIDRFVELHENEIAGYFIIDPTNKTLHAEYFSSVSGNEYLLSLVKDIVSTYNRDERDLMATPQYSGPYRMRATMRRYTNIQQSLIPVKEVFEFSYEEVRKQQTYMKSGIVTHFWEHSWM